MREAAGVWAVAMMLGRYVLALSGDDVPDRALIGGKAWSVASMSAQQMPVPPAVVVTTEACNAILAGSDIHDDLNESVRNGLRWLEGETQRSFGAGPS
ncbi:MAG: PEP/pyruvate-binding domain-containing protein, partial [Pseudomonadota bacterium]